MLSPALFLLFHGSPFETAVGFGMGLSVNEFYAGGFLYTDDIRTLATSEASLEAQVALVNEFANTNFLKLNYKQV